MKKVIDPTILRSYTVFVYTPEDTVEMSVEETAAHWEKIVFSPLKLIAKELGSSKLVINKMMSSGGIAIIMANQEAIDKLKVKGFTYFSNPEPRKL